MALMSRDSAENDLAGALSRHVGYTTGAYDLRRIFNVVEVFKTRTSAYTEEIISDLFEANESRTTSEAYLSEVLNFATSFGLVESVSNRESKLTRYAATELGRSVLGVANLDDQDFRDFFLASIILLADADFLVPLMIHIDTRIELPLLEYFREFTEDLRKKRYDWLRQQFPERILFERIASQIAWLKRTKDMTIPYKVDVPTINTARHHSKPRLGWLSTLRLSTPDNKCLTAAGKAILKNLAVDYRYFWVSPSPNTMATLRVTSPEPSASEVDLLARYDNPLPEKEQIARLVADVAVIMKTAYPNARLIHAEQASLRLPIGYIEYRSYKDHKRYDWQIVLKTVFEEYRGILHRYSAHKGQIGFYKVLSL